MSNGDNTREAPADPDASSNPPPAETLIKMHPCDIFYSQDTIAPVFRRGPEKNPQSKGDAQSSYAEMARAGGKSIHQALKDLQNGVDSVDDYPCIKVVRHKDLYYSLDNRRLWVFKNFGKPITVKLQPTIEKEFFQKLSLSGGGMSVKIVNATEVAKSRDKRRSLEGAVLSWSVENIMSPFLHVNQIKDIPVTFTSLDQYCKAFRLPLIEECRANLQQSFEDVSAVRFFAIEIEDFKTPAAGGDSERQEQLGKLTFTISKKKDMDERRVRMPVKPTDVVLLVSKVPSSIQDLQNNGTASHRAMSTLGKVSKIEEGIITMVVWAPRDAPETLALMESQGRESWYIGVVSSLATPGRIYEGLHKPLEMENGKSVSVKYPVLMEVVNAGSEELTDAEVTPSQISASPLLKAAENYYIRHLKMNESGQMGSVMEATAKLKTAMALDIGTKKSEKKMQLIQGPPGTGKTSTIVGLLSVATCLRWRTLVCAPTNVAVCEVAIRFIKFFNKGYPHQFSDVWGGGSGCERGMWSL